MEIYLDNAATTRVCPEAAETAYKVMTEEYGNPGSTHAKGRSARKLLDRARQQVAQAMGAREGEIFFTSGGTESDNWALRSAAAALGRKGGHIITGATEHEAVLQTVELLRRQGYEVSILPPDESGAVPPRRCAPPSGRTRSWCP